MIATMMINRISPPTLIPTVRFMRCLLWLVLNVQHPSVRKRSGQREN